MSWQSHRVSKLTSIWSLTQSLTLVSDLISMYQFIMTDSAAEVQALKKLVKTCKSVYATSVLLQSTNEDLLLAAHHQHERVTRFRNYYVNARILNLEIIEKRNQKTKNKTQEKFNKQNNMLLNRWLKSFVTADSELFAERVFKQQSSTKKVSSAFIFSLSSSFTSSA